MGWYKSTAVVAEEMTRYSSMISFKEHRCLDVHCIACQLVWLSDSSMYLSQLPQEAIHHTDPPCRICRMYVRGIVGRAGRGGFLIEFQVDITRLKRPERSRRQMLFVHCIHTYSNHPACTCPHHTYVGMGLTIFGMIFPTAITHAK